MAKKIHATACQKNNKLFNQSKKKKKLIKEGGLTLEKASNAKTFIVVIKELIT